MAQYRRDKTANASWFFTVALAERRGNDLLIRQIDVLRQSFKQVQQKHPFRIDAIVILPDHLHSIWTLPEGDIDYATRWGLIKAGFSRQISTQERRSASRIKRGERGIWQRRYWEHRLRDENDFARHVDYIHWNPVKHGYVTRVQDWAYSSFYSICAVRTSPHTTRAPNNGVAKFLVRRAPHELGNVAQFFCNALENYILINRHRVAKSASSGGSSMTQCRCLGNTTQPWMING